MPGTEVVRKQSVLGGAAGIALLAFALGYRFYPTTRRPEPLPVQPVASVPIHAPSTTLAPLPYSEPPLTIQPAPPPGEEASKPAEPATPPPKALAALLKKADKALDAEHWIEPKDGSALALYQQVLDADKDNAQAKAGIEKIHNLLLAQTQAALDRGDEKESARLIAQFATLPGVENEVSGLRGREKIIKQVNPLLSHAADLLRQGHALEPPNGNALGVYREVMKLDPGNKLADAGLTQIESAFIERALAAAAQDNFDEADKILGDAAAIHPGSQQVQDTRSRIEGIRRKRAENTLAQASSALDAGDAELARLLEQKALGISPDLPGVEDFNQRLRNAKLYATFSPGQVITDKFLDRHGTAPALVVIPTGTFAMGSSPNEDGHRPSEEPQRDVVISAGFALGKYDVTVADFRQFTSDSGYITDAEKLGSSSVYNEETGRIVEKHGVTWRDDYLGERAADNLPALHISWNDASAYAAWLAQRTGKNYRLPSEAEFEYALRAGKQTRYPWGDGNPGKAYENITGNELSPHLKRSWAKAFPRYDDGAWGPSPVGKYLPNAFGLFDMDGNVSEWVADCWHDNYTRAPADSRAWINPGCASHVVRGGSWGSAPDQVRSAYRLSAPTETRSARVGMRVAREL